MTIKRHLGLRLALETVRTMLVEERHTKIKSLQAARRLIAPSVDNLLQEFNSMLGQIQSAVEQQRQVAKPVEEIKRATDPVSKEFFPPNSHEQREVQTPIKKSVKETKNESEPEVVRDTSIAKNVGSEPSQKEATSETTTVKTASISEEAPQVEQIQQAAPVVKTETSTAQKDTSAAESEPQQQQAPVGQDSEQSPPAEAMHAQASQQMKPKDAALAQKQLHTKQSVQTNSDSTPEQEGLPVVAEQPAGTGAHMGNMAEGGDGSAVPPESKLQSQLTKALNQLGKELQSDVIHAATQATDAVQKIAQSIRNAAETLDPSMKAQGIQPSSSVSATPQGFTKEAERRDTTDRTARNQARVHSPRFMERVEQVMKEAVQSKDGKSLTFKLDSHELGPIKATVSFRDGTLHARLTAETPHSAEMLSERIGELSTALRKLGIEADKITVAVGTEGMQDSFMDDLGTSREGQAKNSYEHSNGKQAGTTVPFLGGFQDEQGLINKEHTVIVEDHWVA